MSWPPYRAAQSVDNRVPPTERHMNDSLEYEWDVYGRLETITMTVGSLVMERTITYDASGFPSDISAWSEVT